MEVSNIDTAGINNYGAFSLDNFHAIKAMEKCIVEVDGLSWSRNVFPWKLKFPFLIYIKINTHVAH
jgi:hypothetical protein